MKKRVISILVVATMLVTAMCQVVLAEETKSEAVMVEDSGKDAAIKTFVPVLPDPSLQEKREERLVDCLILNVGNYAVVDDGTLKWIDDNNKIVVPFIEGDRTYLPLRFIGESFGADVKWNPENEEITVTLGEDVIIMNIGKTSYTVNGEIKEMDAHPFIREDRTFVPVRYIGEVLNKSVYWDGTLKLVILTPVERPWNPEGEAEKDILPDALLIMSEFVRDLKPASEE